MDSLEKKEVELVMFFRYSYIIGRLKHNIVFPNKIFIVTILLRKVCYLRITMNSFFFVIRFFFSIVNFKETYYSRLVKILMKYEGVIFEFDIM